jgi:hypothetical protein
MSHCYVCNAEPGDPCRAIDGEIAECPRPSVTAWRAADESEFCQGCNPEPTISELEGNKCDCCGKELS